jgi:hypothetical protein
VAWGGLCARLRRQSAAAGARYRGLLRWDSTGFKGRLATVEQLTGDVWRAAAGSMKYWCCRNRSCTSADPRLKTTTWRTVQRLRARFLAVDDEDDGGRRLGQGGARGGGRWPRRGAMVAGGGSGNFSQTMARGGGEEWGCGGVQEGGSLGLIASAASGGSWRAGPGWQRRGRARPPYGAGGGVGGGRRQPGGWAGPSGPSPGASFNVFPFCFVCCLCYFFLVIILLTLAFL